MLLIILLLAVFGVQFLILRRTQSANRIRGAIMAPQKHKNRPNYDSITADMCVNPGATLSPIGSAIYRAHHFHF